MRSNLLMQGSVTLFILAIVLPLLFFGLSLSVDLGKYYRESQAIQTALDDAARHAYRFLPYVQQARTAAFSYLSRINGLAEKTMIAVDSDTITLRYGGAATLSLADYFGVKVAVPVTAYVQVRGAPVDAMIVMDGGAHLAPPVAGGVGWGQPADWPAAYFFQFENPLALNGSPIDPRLATQQCFNPYFSALKQAAINTYSYLQRFDLNAVGLGFYPGAGSPVDIVRNLEPGGLRPQPGNTGEADFMDYEELTASNAYCAAAAEREPNWEPYQFPLPAEGTETGLGNKPQFMITPGSWKLNPDYIPVMSAREVIWSRAAHPNSNGDTAAVLNTIHSVLIGAPNVSKRGGLKNRAIKTAVIFAGDVPRQEAIRFPEGAVPAALRFPLAKIRRDIQAENLIFRLYYVLAVTDGNNDASFEGRIGALRDFFNEVTQLNGSPVPGFEANLLLGSSPEMITQELGSILAAAEIKSSLIAR